MPKENRPTEDTSSTKNSPDIKLLTHNKVKQMFHTTHLQSQLDYSPLTMNNILPIAMSYYLFWKGHMLQSQNSEGSEDAEHAASKYVVAAMQVYPEILDEIVLEHVHTKPLDITKPHDVALYLGVRLAQLELADSSELAVFKGLQQDVNMIRAVAMQEKKEQKSA